MTRYHVTEADHAWIADWLTAEGHEPEQRLVAIHPGTGAAVKQWPAEMWAVVADRLAERPDVRIVLTGSPGERDLVGSIAARLAHPALNGAGATTLGQLATLSALRPRARFQTAARCTWRPRLMRRACISTGRFHRSNSGRGVTPTRHVVLRTTWPCRTLRPSGLAHGCPAATYVHDRHYARRRVARR